MTREEKITKLAKYMTNEILDEWSKEDALEWIEERWKEMLSEQSDEQLDICCAWEHIKE